MANENDLEGRMSHLEEQIGTLSEAVDKLIAISNNYLATATTIQVELLRAPRSIALVDVRELTNSVHNYLLAQAEDASKSEAVEVCMGFIGRRYARAKAQIQQAQSPDEVVQDYHDTIETYLAERGFKPFVEE